MLVLGILLVGVLSQSAVRDSIYDSACSNNQIEYATWSAWEAFGNWGSCEGSCGANGTQSRTATRDCCIAVYDAADKKYGCEGSATKDESQSCVLGAEYGCGDDSDNFRLFKDTRCEENDKTYLGVAGSIQDCRDLYDQFTESKSAYMLECFSNNLGKRPFPCYVCLGNIAEMESSDCGSRVYLDPSYDWNYGIIIAGLIVGILTLAGAWAADTFKIFGEAEENEEKAREMNKQDALYVPIDDGAICPCFPDWMNLSTMTFVMCCFGFVLGAGLNIAFDKSSEQSKSDWLKIIYYPGELWVYSLKLIVSPLISLMMLTLPDRVNVMGSKLGQHIVLFYIFTSSIAACEGLFWVNIIKPGDANIYITAGSKDAGTQLSELDSLLGIGRKALPSNIITALQGSNVLGLITFFLTLGAFIQSPLVDKEWRDTFMNAAKAALKGIMLAIPLIVTFTPFAMVSIITYQISKVDNLQEVLVSVGKYILTVIVAQGIHMFVFYPILLVAFAGVNPYRYWSKIKRAPLTAFATSSSAATLPVSLDVLKRNDIDWRIVDFVAPLGSAINMDGTSCGFPIMCMWIAQMENYDVDAGSQIVLALLAMTCSVGTAPIPNAGIVYVSMLLTSLGGPFEDPDKVAAGVAFILIFDWLVDRIETMQNVWSDCVACKIFDAMGYDDLDKTKDAEMVSAEMASVGVAKEGADYGGSSVGKGV